MLLEKKYNKSITLSSGDYILEDTEDDSKFIICRVKKIPSLEVNSNEFPYLNTSSWAAGRYSWSNLVLETNDHDENRCMEFIKLLTEHQFESIGYSFKKKSLQLLSVDKNQKWYLTGCMLNSLHNSLNFDNCKSNFFMKMEIAIETCILTY